MLGVSITWMLPSCGSGRPHCWHGHSVRSPRPCGYDFFHALRRAGALVRPGPSARAHTLGRLALLFSPCTAHYNSPLLERAVHTWQHMTWAELLTNDADCLDHPVECAARRCPAAVAAAATNISVRRTKVATTSPTVARGPACKPAGGLATVAAEASLNLRHQLHGLLTESVRELRLLGSMGHLAILVESQPSHFPQQLLEPDQAVLNSKMAHGQVRVASTGSDFALGSAYTYDRFVLEPLVALIHRAQHGLEAAHYVRPLARRSSPLLEMLQITPSQPVIPWTGLRGGKNYAWMLQGALALDTRCAKATSPIACWRAALGDSAASAHTLFASLRPLQCAPPRAPRHRSDHGANIAGYEREVASAHGVPLLQRFESRVARWDSHPAATGGDDPGSASLDCVHSSFAPGVWDGELAAWHEVLRTHGGGSLPEPQDFSLWIAHKAAQASRFFRWPV